MDIVSRLQKVLSYSKLSVRALAVKCNLKQQTLDKHLKGISEPSANTLVGILSTFPEISADWLLLGEGEMFKTDISARETERTEKLIDTITTLQESINAKNDTISTLTEKIKQLETQLKK